MKIRIDGKEIEVTAGETILEAARRAGIRIPTLCYHEAFGGQGVCRFCMVEVKEGDRTRLVASCTYPVTREIEVNTCTPAIEEIRRNIITLLYRRAPNSEFMKDLYLEYGAPAVRTRDAEERCIMCRLCVNACKKMETNAIAAVFRGIDKRIGTPYDEASDDCIGCGACAAVCPTGAIDAVLEGGYFRIWNKTFELATCAKCGRSYGSHQVLDSAREKLGPDFREENLCPTCRMKAAARVIADSRLKK